MAFLDATGTCLNPGEARPADQPRARRRWWLGSLLDIAHEGYPAALDQLRAHGVEITFGEDRQSSVLNGPRAYFHDADGRVLEFIDLTSYAGGRL